MTRISFIGFGEAARSWCKSLGEAGGAEICAYDILLGSDQTPSFEKAASALDVHLAASAVEAVDGAEYIVSAVTASQCLAAARSVVPGIEQGQVYFDINSVSPARKHEAAAAISSADGTYVDMAVMAPVQRAGHRTPVLLAGELMQDTIAMLERFGFSFEIVGEAAGAATEIKMIRSLFVKGLEALTIEVLTAARKAGCYERIFGSLSRSYPGLDWTAFPAYQFERVASHGIRRAAEMEESSATLGELARPQAAALAAAIAEVHQAVGACGLDMTEMSDAQDCADALLHRIAQAAE